MSRGGRGGDERMHAHPVLVWVAVGQLQESKTAAVSLKRAGTTSTGEETKTPTQSPKTLCLENTVEKFKKV